MKILIAEDHYANQRVLKAYLSEYGECNVVGDGETALVEFKAALEEGAPYELICLDVIMPLKSGAEVLRGIREEEKLRNVQEDKQAKVMVITSMDSKREAIPQESMDSVVFVTKPILRDGIQAVVEKLGFSKINN